MLKVGMIIGERYEIAGRVGTGGMANVYKAKDHKLNRFVAIKVLKQEFSEDKTFIRKFQTEAQAAAGLAHPNIVNVFDVGEEDGIYYIVMELVEGITLKEYIARKGKLSIKEATSIAIQVSMGLEAAHDHNIVHRDVKPQNIIISTDGKVKVTDFGIARAASSNTISSNVMGSVHYSSPEQVRGGYSDAKSDIYSLGITIYEMVTGRVPFEGDTTVAIAIKHLQEEITPPSQFNPQLPFALEQIILKCTQKSVDRRYGNMADVIADLKRSLIDPNGTFVNLVPLSNHAQTVVISSQDLEQIKQGQQAGLSHDPVPKKSYQRLEEEEELDDDLYDDDDDDDDDDDGRGGISTKLEKAMTIGGLIIGAMIICILIFFIARAAGLIHFGGDKEKKPDTEQTEQTKDDEDEDTVEMPSLLGKSEEEAKEILSELGLGLKYEGEEASNEYEAGLITYQSVAAGEKVEKHTTIKYKVSSGNEELSMPDVTNQSQTDAEATLKAMGLETEIVKEKSTEVEIGDVISTDPAAGASVKKGDKVVVKVSIGKGDTSVTVPNLMGVSEADAKSQLESLGLNVIVETGTSNRVGEGEVMAQSISGGKKVDIGSNITITINSPGEDQEEVASGESSAGGTWKCSGQALGEPSDYQGGAVKLELTQEVNGTTKTTTITEGQVINFPYSLKDVVGEPGVSTGTIYLYELVDGEYVPRSAYKNLTFKNSND
ncbi:MAG: Stk1 family PASTA domain-containing Ser/Thr kinase [Lachnospiraceae bacterium]|jgi:serine/threonine protein kinase/beta-lactam-binding protein with PASTA domain